MNTEQQIKDAKLKSLARTLSNFANPTRIDIVNILFEQGPMDYTNLMRTAGFRPKSDGGNESGKFAYHLRKLTGYELVQKLNRKYGLTDLGIYMNILTSPLVNPENRELKDLIFEAVGNKSKIRVIYENLENLKDIVDNISYSQINLKNITEKSVTHQKFGDEVKLNSVPKNSGDFLINKLTRLYSLTKEEESFCLYVMKSAGSEFDYKKATKDLNWDVSRVMAIHNSLLDKQAIKKASRYNKEETLAYYLLINLPRKYSGPAVI